MKLLAWGIILLCLPAVFAEEGSISKADWPSFAPAQEGTIKLLALAETSDGKTAGLAADLDLQVIGGHNRVFLETFPMTKITTQASFRFAQQVACRELDVDCSGRDFLFTIRALPGIVGGPSAGSAAAVLTAALIADLDLRNDTAITGTINSGGVIGPVGGLKDKISAASDAGIRRVLIPMGTREFTDNATNITTDLVAFGKERGLDVIEVSTLFEALHEYSGKVFPNVSAELVIEPRYVDTMRDVALDLCNRSGEVRLLLERKHTGENTTELEGNAVEMRKRADEAFADGQFYSSASYCFRSSVQYKRALALQRPWTERQIAKALLELRARELNYSREVDARPINTITDVQTYMAVKERLFDVEESFLEIAKNLNDTKASAEQLAYAEERLFSAVTWARFFNGDGRKFVVDSASLRESCTAKISEAEERINYVRSILPNSLAESRRELDTAYSDLSRGNYTLCLYKASKNKAEADVILSVAGVEESRVDELIDLKLRISRDAIVKSQLKGIFPIIGYSYYEYAGSLRDLDKYSTLLFSEYALEFSNLDIYFSRRGGNGGFWGILKPHIGWLGIGIVIGLFFALVLEAWHRSLDRHPKKRSRGRKFYK